MFKDKKQLESPLLKILSPFPASQMFIDGAAFARAVELARRNGVEMLFYARLKKHYAGLHACVDEYLEKNYNAYLMAVARSMKEEAVENEVVASLARKHVMACLIKGNTLARIIYEDPNCRSSADIDLLVRTEDLAAADNLLKEMGFLRHESLPLNFVVGRLHHLVYSNEEKRIPMELHWDFGFPLYFNMTPADIWKGVTGNDRQGYSLTPQNTMIMLLMHHFRHGFRELKILVDILWSFYRYDNVINWWDFAETLRKFGMVKTTVIVLQQLDDLWKLADGRLASFKVLRQQIDALPERPAKFLLRYFRMDIERNEPGTPDMQMAKLVLDRKANIFYSFVKIFFPKPREVEAFYPETGKWMLPFNYMRFIFWRVKKR